MELLQTKNNKTFPNEFIDVINKIINKSPNTKSKISQNEITLKKPSNLNDIENIQSYILHLISKIQKSNKNEEKDILEKTYKNLVKLQESNLPVFVDINIFVPEDMNKVDLYLEEKKKLQNEILFLGNKRKESFLTNCEEFNTKEKYPFSYPSKKNCQTETQLFIPKFNKIPFQEKNFGKKQNFFEKEKISKPPSIFKSCSNNDVLFSNLSSKNLKKGFKEKIAKFKTFWKNNKESYPFAFMKKRIKKYGIDGTVYFEEIYDISKKEIPSKNDFESNIPF